MDCQHLNRVLESVGPMDKRGRRTITLRCEDCGETLNLPSLRTDEELAAEGFAVE